MPKSKLEQTVSKKLRMILYGVPILENTRPDWLVSSQGERLELDFYIPELDLAIEVQGQQHYTFVPHFHFNQNGFSDQLRRDREKRFLCTRKGIVLLEIDSNTQLDDFATKIIAMIPQAETDKDFVARMKEYNEAHPERIGPMRKKNWRHGGRIKAKHFPAYRNKLLRLTKAIRVLNKQIITIKNELPYVTNQAVFSTKQQKLTNLEKSQSERLLGLKIFIGNWSKEIRIAFFIYKYR